MHDQEEAPEWSEPTWQLQWPPSCPDWVDQASPAPPGCATSSYQTVGLSLFQCPCSKHSFMRWWGGSDEFSINSSYFPSPISN